MMARYMTKKSTETLTTAEVWSPRCDPVAATIWTGCSMVSSSAATIPRSVTSSTFLALRLLASSPTRSMLLTPKTTRVRG